MGSETQISFKQHIFIVIVIWTNTNIPCKNLNKVTLIIEDGNIINYVTMFTKTINSGSLTYDL